MSHTYEHSTTIEVHRAVHAAQFKNLPPGVGHLHKQQPTKLLKYTQKQ
jgi:hypothetical protein